MKEVLERFKEKRVLVVGDICLDRSRAVDFVKGSSREADIPTLRHVKGKEGHKEEYSPGGGANLAANLTSLDAKVTILGVIGKDHHGDILKKELEKRGINTENLIRSDERATLVFERSYDCNDLTKPIARWDVENSKGMNPQVEEELISKLLILSKENDAIIVIDHCEVEESTAIINVKVLETLSNIKDVKIFGTSRNRIGKFKNLYCLIPNENESSRATNLYQPKNFEEEIPENIVIEAGKTLLKYSNSQKIVMTTGAKGAILFNRKELKNVPTKELKENIDICGCGDTFLATLTLAEISGASEEESINLANTAAGTTARKLGTTGTPTIDEILKNL